MAPDIHLLQAWRAGDRGAGGELIERHFQSIYRFFRNKVVGDVEDLVQRTFLACVESRDVFRSEASFRSYLFAIARNELHGFYRRRGVADEDLGSRSVADIDPLPSPTENLAKRGEQRLLLRALRSLPLDDQIALELFYWENLDGKELARVIGVGEPTARTRLRRARRVLERRLMELADNGEALRATTDDIDRWAGSLRDVLRAEGRWSG